MPFEKIPPKKSPHAKETQTRLRTFACYCIHIKIARTTRTFQPSLKFHDDVVFTLEIEEEEAGNEEKSLIIVRNVGNGRVLAYLKKINFNLEDAPFSSSSEYSNRKCMKS